ncbi:MAG TPA: AAA family ATPase [Anaerolineae bacterium]|nr:AAA family ATPase [Anaerolineae bacterium]
MSSIPEEDLIDEGALPPDDFHEYIERIQEIADFELIPPSDLMERVQRESLHLLVEPGILRAAACALQVGNLVLQGPPGTGKSSLARALCRAFHCSALPVTAHEDWTTYEVIGRQTLVVDEQGREQIIPLNGFFTEAVIRCAGQMVRHFDNPDEPQATWLLIDELNRAHIDRAFGELLTVLGTDELVPITLQYQKEGNREIVTPRRFRVIGTLNSVDRQFVNSLGQGLKRRFSFITLDIPGPRRSGEPWGSEDADASIASKEFSVVSERAAQRAARRAASDQHANSEASSSEFLGFLARQARPTLESLFDLIERARYAEKGTDQPYLPIGTAQLIDTVELFLVRAYFDGADESHLPPLMDWAASVKLAPLFDTDTISPEHLQDFADGLTEPFDKLMRQELLQIVSLGQFYVKP